MIGFVYFLIIILANAIGAVSGMGGGVLIKPIFDFIGYHSVASISFYSAVAVFTMSIVSTIRQVKNGIKINWKIVGWIAGGSIIGGIIGNILFDLLLHLFSDETRVQLVQIVITIGTLIFAFLYSKYEFKQYSLKKTYWYLLCGLLLGFLASLLGIGGGPINVSLMILMFGLPIKEATVYSICTILFSQSAKLVTILFTSGLGRYDLTILQYVIPAAIIGGLIGAKFSKLLSPERVTLIFQMVIIVVLLVNLYNGSKII